MPSHPKPVGGHILAHFSTTRIMLRKGRAEQRIALLVLTTFEGVAVQHVAVSGRWQSNLPGSEGKSMIRPACPRARVCSRSSRVESGLRNWR